MKKKKHIISTYEAKYIWQSRNRMKSEICYYKGHYNQHTHTHTQWQKNKYFFFKIETMQEYGVTQIYPSCTGEIIQCMDTRK